MSQRKPIPAAICAVVTVSALLAVSVSDARGLRGGFNAASGARAATVAPRPITRTPLPPVSTASSATSVGRGSITTSRSATGASRAAAHGQGSYARTWNSTATTGTRFGGQAAIRGRVTTRAYRHGTASTLQRSVPHGSRGSTFGTARRVVPPVSSAALASKRAAAPAKGSLTRAFKEARQADNRMHVTYLGIDRKTGRPYVGYASKAGASNVDEVLKYRYGKQYKRFGGKAPRVITHGYGLQGKARTRGTEQLVYERYQRRAVGTANRQNPVGRNNKRADTYRRQGGDVMRKFRRR